MTISYDSNDGLWIIFLVGVAIASTLCGVVFNDFIVLIAGVATILLTTVLLLRMTDQFRKNREKYIR